MKICHVISPFLAPDSSDLSVAQPITFETMRKARMFSEQDVDLMAFLAEAADVAVVPDDFRALPVAARTTADIIHSTTRRALPLIQDIVGAALEASDADYLIYSNADIAVQPYFYDYVAERMKDLDALVINRKTVIRDIDELNNLSFYYSQGGKTHPGYDCFIASRELWEKAELSQAFIGGNWIGRVILLNMAVLARRFAIEEDKQLTFHLGDDRSWQNPAMAAYHSFNNLAVIKTCERLMGQNPATDHMLTRVMKGHRKGRYPDIKDDLRALMQKWQNPVTQDPLFVFGFPRSGTTLVQSLIERGTSNVVTPPEMHFFNVLRYLNLEDRTDLGHEEIRLILDKLLEKITIGEELHAKLDRLHFEISVKEMFELLVADQLKQCYDDLPPNYRWLEKTPGHAVSVRKLKSLFPKGKFIYVLRHPIFAFTSWRKNAASWGDTSELDIEYLCGIYRHHLSSAIQFKNANPNQLMFIKLESIVKDPLTSIKDISRFIGQHVDELALNSDSASDHIVKSFEPWKLDAVTKSISPSIAYPNELLVSKAEVEYVWKHLGELLKQMNYAKVIPITSVPSFEQMRVMLETTDVTPSVPRPDVPVAG